MDVKHKVSVGVPLPRFPGITVHPAGMVQDSLMHMYDHCQRHNVEVKEIPLDTGRGLHVQKNHTNLANAMWGDWLLIVGSDHSFGRDALVKLLDAATDEEGNCVRPIISGVCVYRQPPHRLIGYRRDPSGLNMMSLRPGIDFDEAAQQAGVVLDIPNGATGSGFCLYHRKVFDMVPYPWFDGGVRMKDMVSYGPDIRICVDAADVGLVPAIHLGVEVMHWDYRAIEPGKCMEFIQNREWWDAEMFHMTNSGINEDAVQELKKMWVDTHPEEVGDAKSVREKIAPSGE